MNYSYTYKGFTFEFIKNADISSEIFYSDIVDCEHWGDVDSQSALISSLGGIVHETYWDRKDNGEAYVAYSCGKISDLFRILNSTYDMSVIQVCYLLSDYLIVANGIEDGESVTYQVSPEGKIVKSAPDNATEETELKPSFSDLSNELCKELDPTGKHLVSHDEFIGLIPVFGYYAFFEEGDGLVSEYSSDAISVDEFRKAISLLADNGYLLTDDIAARLGLPLYGEVSYNFSTEDYPNSRVSSVKGGKIRVSNESEEVPFGNPMSSSEFDEFFRMVTGYDKSDIIM